jgi:hypothetical protein
MSRLFDPVSLMNANLEENATRRDPLPQGEVLAQITKLDFKNGTISKGDRAGQQWDRLDCTLEITDQEYLAQYGDGTQPKATTNLGIMLEMTDVGAIATGPNKNVRLGRLREAAGVNGKPLGMLQGQFVRIKIDHKPHPTEDGVVLDEITGYTKP